MVERAAHLVDRALPVVPVRRWVLSLPCGNISFDTQGNPLSVNACFL